MTSTFACLAFIFVGAAAAGGDDRQLHGRAAQLRLGAKRLSGEPVPVTATVLPAILDVTQGQRSSPLTLRVEAGASESGRSFLFSPSLPPPLQGRVTFEPANVGITVPPGASGGTASFRLACSADAPVGTYTVLLTDPDSAVEVGFTVRIEASRVRVRITPESVVAVAGGMSETLTLSVAGSDPAGLPRDFGLQLPARLAGRVTLDPAPLRFTAGRDSITATFRIVCAPGTPADSSVLALESRSRPDLRATFRLTVLAPTARMVVDPGRVSLVLGQASPALTLRITDGNLAGVSLSLVAAIPDALAGQVALEPPQLRLTVSPGGTGTASFHLTSTFDARPGSYEVSLREPSLGLRTAFRLEVLPLPVIEAVSPDSASAGQISMTVRVLGRGFAPGAVVTSAAQDLRFGATRVLTPSLAETTLSVRADTPPGRYRLDVVNPDGGRSRTGGVLRVLSPDSLIAPVTVRTAAILSPLPGALLADGEEVYPLALLATTGSGSIVGAWLLDGIPFDRFAVQATGGLPLSVTTRVPIAAPALGTHRLQIAIEAPQRLASEPVTFLRVGDRAGSFRLLEPVEGAVLAAGKVELRWLPQPGVAGYEIELYQEGKPGGLRRQVSLSRWRLEGRDLAAIAPGTWLWRVRPLFVGGVKGRATAPRRFTVLPRQIRLDLRPPVAEEPGGQLRLHWQGGVPGLLYRIEVLAAGGRPVHSALTAESSYALPLLPELARGGWGARVSAWGPGAQRLGDAQLTGLPPATSGPAASGEPPASAESPAVPRAWSLTAEGLVTVTGGSELPEQQASGNLALAGELDASGKHGSAIGTGSFALTRALRGEVPEVENHSWVVHGEAPGPWHMRATTGQTGYVAPGFFLGSELMSAGLTKGGGEATITLPGGFGLSYYGTFDPETAGAAGGGAGAKETMQGGALTIPAGRLQLRVVALDVDEAATEFDPGGRGRLTGLISSWDLSPALQIAFEGARGDFTPAGDAGGERHGEALRLRLSGSAGGWTYGGLLSRSASGFVNPANRGLTPGGVSDRSSAELQANGAIGRVTTGLTYQHIEGGEGDAVLDAGGLTFAVPLTPAVQLSLAGNLAATRSGGGDELGLPASDLRTRMLSLGLSETLGRFSFTQSFQWQETNDRFDPGRFGEVTDAGLTISGALRSNFGVNAQIRGTRSRLAPELGTQESLLATVEPTLTLPAYHLALRTSASYTRNRTSFVPGDQRTEGYRAALSWNPPWLASLLSLEASTDWTRTRGPDLPDTGFVRAYTAALAARWGNPR